MQQSHSRLRIWKFIVQYINKLVQEHKSKVITSFFNSDILLFPTPYIKLLFVDLPIINSFFIWISYYIEIALRDIKQ
jgi:hypothetical protein